MMPKKNLRALVLIICLFVLHPASVFAGGIGGGGGHESALLFRSLGQLIYNELKLNRDQMTMPGENEIDPEAFKTALETTDIIPILSRENPAGSLSKVLLKCYDDAQNKYSSGFTALYAFNCDNNNKGILFLMVEEFNKNTINNNLGASFVLVSHEYFRAMKLDDNNYNISVNYYVEGFFTKILDKPETKEILEIGVNLARIEYKFNSQFGSESKQNIDNNYIENLRIEIARMDINISRYYELILSSAIRRDEIEAENQSKLNLGTGVRIKKNTADALTERDTFASDDLNSTRNRLKKYENAIDDHLFKKRSDVL